MPTSSKEKESDEHVVYGLVTRYGPQSVASASGEDSKLLFSKVHFILCDRW